MSSFFIKHPTIAIVISIVMILLGGLSLMGLPIEQYPNIVPPTIKMQATYPGANACCREYRTTSKFVNDAPISTSESTSAARILTDPVYHHAKILISNSSEAIAVAAIAARLTSRP